MIVSGSLLESLNINILQPFVFGSFLLFSTFFFSNLIPITLNFEIA